MVEKLSQICEIVAPRWLKQAFIGICLVLYPPSHYTMQLSIQCGSNTRVQGFPKIRPRDVVPVDSERVSDYVLLVLQSRCRLGFPELILVHLVHMYWNKHITNFQKLCKFIKNIANKFVLGFVMHQWCRIWFSPSFIFFALWTLGYLTLIKVNFEEGFNEIYFIYVLPELF